MILELFHDIRSQTLHNQYIFLLEIKGSYRKLNVWYSLLDQTERSNRRRKRQTQLHQLERSSQSNKTCVFTAAIRIYHTGRLLRAFYYHSCDSVLAKNHTNAVLSAARQSSSFVWLDSCTLCVLWQLDR